MMGGYDVTDKDIRFKICISSASAAFKSSRAMWSCPIILHAKKDDVAQLLITMDKVHAEANDYLERSNS